MDTKSKKLRFNIWFKVLAWALSIASGIGIVFSSISLSQTQIPSSAASYKNSEWFQSEMRGNAYSVFRAFNIPSDEVISNEADVYVATLNSSRQEEIERMLSLLDAESSITYSIDSSGYAVIENEITVTEEAMQPEAAISEEDTSTASEVISGSFYPDYPEDEGSYTAEYIQERLDTINKKYEKLIKNAEKKIREDYENIAQTSKNWLAQNEGLLYAIFKDGQVTETNIKDDAPLDVIEASEADVVAIFDTAEQSLQYLLTDDADAYSDSWMSVNSGEVIVYTAMTDDAYAAKSAEYSSTYESYKFYVVWLVVFIILFIAAFVWLMYTAGKNEHDDAPKVLKLDFVYLDIGFVLLILAEICFVLIVVFNMNTLSPFIDFLSLDAMGMTAIGASVAGAVSVFLLWCTSLARRTKTGTAREFTLIGAIGKNIKTAYDGAGLKSRLIVAYLFYIIVAVIIGGLLVAGGYWWDTLLTVIGVFLLIIYVLLTLIFIFRKTGALNKLSIGVEELKNGNMDYIIPKTGDKEIDGIADGINNIADGLKSAVSKEVKAERMRTELITNISHDLKTPLTSILTYIDLLKKHEMDEEAKKYVEILDSKSMRLKILTDDLFEAAKASSGDITVNFTNIELLQFMQQAMAELADRMEESGLAFVVSMPEEKTYVWADGKLLFRVISNILDNAIKYSHTGSRVYIDIVQNSHGVCVIVKNVSKEPLNITEAELMERFVRGDSSRNTEGSGLGLAIAKDFMRVMNGEFIIEIDGDLFKANICLPKADTTEAPPAQDAPSL